MNVSHRYRIDISKIVLLIGFSHFYSFFFTTCLLTVLVFSPFLLTLLSKSKQSLMLCRWCVGLQVFTLHVGQTSSFVLLRAVRLKIIQNVKMQNADTEFEKTDGPWMLETNALMKTTGKKKGNQGSGWS